MYTLKPCSANNPFFKAVFSTSTDTEICILEVSLSRVMKRRNPACHGNFHHYIISFQVEKSHIITTNYADESILFAFFHRKAMVLLALPDANGTHGGRQDCTGEMFYKGLVSQLVRNTLLPLRASERPWRSRARPSMYCRFSSLSSHARGRASTPR